MNNDQQQLERLFGGNPHLKATLEQTGDFGGSHPATKEAQPIFGDKQSLLRHVVQRAQSLGTWIERIDGNYHFIDAVVNDIRYPIDKINKISIKHPGKRST